MCFIGLNLNSKFVHFFFSESGFMFVCFLNLSKQEQNMA